MTSDLRPWLTAAAILTGQQKGSPQKQQHSKESAKTVYAARLDEAQAVLPAQHQKALILGADEGGELSEDALRLKVGDLVYEVATHIGRICAELPLVEAPTFSITDNQVLELLGGLLAGWALAPYCTRELLSPQAQVPALPTSTFESQQQQQRLAQLEERLRGCLDCVLPRAHMQPSTSRNTRLSSSEQLADVLLKPCLFGLYPALAELALKEQVPWVQERIQVFFGSLKPQVNFANLLQLMALASANKAAWAVKGISLYLSSQLREPNGIYSLFQCMVRPEDPDPSAQVLERIARLILAPPPDYPRAAHFALVVAALLHILRDASKNNIPFGIVKGAAFVLSRIVLARHRSALPHLLGSFFKQREPRLQNQEKATASTSNITAITATSTVESVHVLSTWLQNAPPSHQLTDEVLRPHLALILSLFSYLKASQDPQASKTSLFKPDLSVLAPLTELLVLWLQRTDTHDLVSSLQLGMEALHDQEARYRPPEGAFWSADSQGQPCLLVKPATPSSDAEQPFDGGLDSPGLSIHPETLIDLVDSPGCGKDLKAALMLRWLGEVELANGSSSQVSPAQSFFTMQLLSQAIEKWGPETLEKPEDALSFVAFAVRERPQELDDPTEGVSIEDLNLDPDSAKDLSAAALQSQLPTLGLTYLSFVLQAHRTLNSHAQRLLDTLLPSVEKLTRSSDHGVATMASDVQHLLDMRCTSERVSKAAKVSDDPYEDSREQFKQAVELLQDPILPIKAAGVDVLRKLITVNTDRTDAQLWPEITNVLISAVGNDDSYLYQRAVQCLCDLCLLKPQIQGAEIAKKLAVLYSDKPENILLPRDLDRRLRFGEALSSLVKASGSAVALYVDSLVPVLLSVIRNAQQPTILRASSLTCMGDCVEASVLALLPYLDADLVDISLSVLTLESTSSTQQRPESPDPLASTSPPPVDVDQIFEEELERLRPDHVRRHRRPEETPNPLTHSAKEQPSLRRAACFFLSCLVDALPEHPHVVDGAQLNRMVDVLQYVGQTDPDPLVQHQAQQVLESLGARDTAHKANVTRFLP